ncbi:DUF433 domain-containing protein [Acidobacteriota bacterium]
METKTLDAYIEVSESTSGGKPRIAGRRITVQDIVIWHDRMGRSADELAAEYDLTLAEIYAALAYYFDHRDQIDSSLQESRRFIEALRDRTPSKLAQRPLDQGEHGSD